MLCFCPILPSPFLHVTEEMPLFLPFSSCNWSSNKHCRIPVTILPTVPLSSTDLNWGRRIKQSSLICRFATDLKVESVGTKTGRALKAWGKPWLWRNAAHQACVWVCAKFLLYMSDLLRGGLSRGQESWFTLWKNPLSLSFF